LQREDVSRAGYPQTYPQDFAVLPQASFRVFLGIYVIAGARGHRTCKARQASAEIAA
jgi:hypothetical protein